MAESDELVAAPPTGDPRIHLRPVRRSGFTVVFNGATSADMHGSVYVENKKPPKLSVGSVISIEA